MGEVYRARDARLKRDVALKVLHPAQATPEHVQRLTREARAAGALNHPNILAVFDVGTERGVPYVVSELLEGESLRQRMDRGLLPYRKALEYAIHIAQALAAAHEKGICHRDVKPGNVFLTTDGRVKLLDFGLAKLDEAGAVDTDAADSTASAISRAGMVFGTVGYMAPEQVLGEPADHRTDVFTLGAVLYEMLTGVRAFQRASSVETMTAILRDDPTNPLELNPALPPAAAAAVRRCLEKNREERFQSARDLAFHLQQLEQATTGVQPRPLPLAARRGRLLAAGLVAAAGVWAAWLIWQQIRERQAPSLQQITFRRGRIGGARFTSTGEIVYSQTAAAGVPDVWLVSSENPEARRLLLARADVLDARPDRLALSLERRFVIGQRIAGTLAMKTLAGDTAPRVMVPEAEVEGADWDPAGEHLAVVHSPGVGAPSRLEYRGRELHRSTGSIQSPRFSPDGRRVAFLEDSEGLGRGGKVAVVDLDGGAHRYLTDYWFRARGVTWSPDGDEIWFTATKGRANRQLLAVDLEGKARVILSMAGSLALWDVAGERTLLSREDERLAVRCAGPAPHEERDLSLSNNTSLAALSADGRFFLSGDRFEGYLVPTDGSEPTPLGVKDVLLNDLSPEGQGGSRVLANGESGDSLIVAPINGMGEARPLRISGIDQFSNARWFPDGERILFRGYGADGRIRSYVMRLPDGPPRALTRPGTWALSISPDGRRVAAIGDGQTITIWPVADDAEPGAPTPVPHSRPGDRPEAWHVDGRSLWVVRRGDLPATVELVDVETGKREVKMRLRPPDLVGVSSIDQFRITPAGDVYCYSYRQILSELYLVTGLR